MKSSIEFERVREEMRLVLFETDKMRQKNEVLEQRLAFVGQQVKELQSSKLNEKNFWKLEAQVEHMGEANRVRFEQNEKALRSSIDYMLNH